MIGTSLNQYQITAQLGAGGIGEVVRANDTRLNRDVAAKVLPPDFAVDESRPRRFEQETRTLVRRNALNILIMFNTSAHGGAVEILPCQNGRERVKAVADDHPTGARHVGDDSGLESE